MTAVNPAELIDGQLYGALRVRARRADLLTTHNQDVACSGGRPNLARFCFRGKMLWPDNGVGVKELSRLNSRVRTPRVRNPGYELISRPPGYQELRSDRRDHGEGTAWSASGGPGMTAGFLVG